MNKGLKKLLIISVAGIALVGNTFSASAAGLKSVFNAKYYSDNYSDLNAAFGYDEKALYQHYRTFGLSEGRYASPVIDVLQYRQAYADLNAAFGDNWDAYVNHYLTYGMYEGRTEGVFFNPQQYANAYADIKAVYGNNWSAIIDHYLNYGMKEGRRAGTVEQSQNAEESAQEDSGNSSSSDSSDVDDGGGQVTYSWKNYNYSCTSTSVAAGFDTLEGNLNRISDLVAYDQTGNTYPVEIASWDYNDYDYQNPGKYSVYGNVVAKEGATIPFELPKFVCHVTVSGENYCFGGYYTFKDMPSGYSDSGQPYAVKLSEEDLELTVVKGTKNSDIVAKAPQINLWDGKMNGYDSPAISWDFSAYNPEVEGVYEIVGSLAEWKAGVSKFDGIELPDITLKVTVSGEGSETDLSEFWKYGWDKDGVRWLPDYESDSYYVTLSVQACESYNMSLLSLYAIGTNENGEKMSYKVNITFDPSTVDFQTPGLYICSSTIEVEGDYELPFELPEIVLKCTIRE